MRTIVAGGRDFIGTDEHKKWLIEKLNELKTTIVVCGMQDGADLFGKAVAEELGLKVDEYPANWKKYKKRAGYLRNVEMAHNADSVILFPGNSGTKMMKDIAVDMGLKLIERGG